MKILKFISIFLLLLIFQLKIFSSPNQVVQIKRDYDLNTKSFIILLEIYSDNKKIENKNFSINDLPILNQNEVLYIAFGKSFTNNQVNDALNFINQMIDNDRKNPFLYLTRAIVYNSLTDPVKYDENILFSKNLWKEYLTSKKLNHELIESKLNQFNSIKEKKGNIIAQDLINKIIEFDPLNSDYYHLRSLTKTDTFYSELDSIIAIFYFDLMKKDIESIFKKNISKILE